MNQNDFKLNWHRSINFGDLLNPYIINHFLGFYPPKYEEVKNKNNLTGYLEKEHYMLLGSILEEANKNTTVIGAGFSSIDSKCIEKPNFISVRGNLTLQKIKSLYNVTEDVSIGDPGIALPKIFYPDVEKKYKLGIIPHIIDVDDVIHSYTTEERWSNSNTRIINLKCWNFPEDIENVIVQILECDAVISSSLHGLIIAHAYGIPALWVEFSDRVLGGGFKFKDYFSAHLDNFEDYYNYNAVDLRSGLKNYTPEEIIQMAEKCRIDLSSTMSETYLLYKEIFKNEYL